MFKYEHCVQTEREQHHVVEDRRERAGRPERRSRRLPRDRGTDGIEAAASREGISRSDVARRAVIRDLGKERA
jgi:hypothetical protein